MVKVTKRKDQIMAIVRERGLVAVSDLAEALGVSTQTVRRDLDDLCNNQKLRRLHGGVECLEQQVNDPYDLRMATNPDFKCAIANAVSEEISDGSSIFISIGSTPTRVAEALRGKKSLTVMTNNLNAAMVLSSETSNRIIIPGGEMRLPDRDLLGEDVVSFFESYRADFGIFGVAGVDEAGALLDFHVSEVRVRETIKRNSRISILVLDSTKFGRVAPAAGGNILEMDRVYSDGHLTADYRPLQDQIGERLFLVGSESE